MKRSLRGRGGYAPLAIRLFLQQCQGERSAECLASAHISYPRARVPNLYAYSLHDYQWLLEIPMTMTIEMIYFIRLFNYRINPFSVVRVF